MLRLALENVHDIPEKDLIYLLQFWIANDGKRKDSCKGISMTKMLSLIVEAPRNDNMMRWCLRQLAESELLVVLKIMCKWIEKHDRVDAMLEPISKQKGPNTTTKRRRKPSFQKVSFRF